MNFRSLGFQSVDSNYADLYNNVDISLFAMQLDRFANNKRSVCHKNIQTGEIDFDAKEIKLHWQSATTMLYT